MPAWSTYARSGLALASQSHAGVGADDDAWTGARAKHLRTLLRIMDGQRTGGAAAAVARPPTACHDSHEWAQCLEQSLARGDGCVHSEPFPVGAACIAQLTMHCA